MKRKQQHHVSYVADIAQDTAVLPGISAFSSFDLSEQSCIHHIGTLQVYYASQVTDGNKRTQLNERFGEQAPEDTTATESDRYVHLSSLQST